MQKFQQVFEIDLIDFIHDILGSPRMNAVVATMGSLLFFVNLNILLRFKNSFFFQSKTLSFTCGITKIRRKLRSRQKFSDIPTQVDLEKLQGNAADLSWSICGF